MKLVIKRGNEETPKRRDFANRDLLVSLVGINTGLRVSDIVKLKVGDLKGKNNLPFEKGKR